MGVRAGGLLLLSLFALAGCGQPTPPRFDRDRIPVAEEPVNTLVGDTGQNTPRPGSCSATGSECSDAGVCVPTTCDALGVVCGEAPDGCGTVLNCGLCGVGAVCVDNACVRSGI